MNLHPAVIRRGWRRQVAGMCVYFPSAGVSGAAGTTGGGRSLPQARPQGSTRRLPRRSGTKRAAGRRHHHAEDTLTARNEGPTGMLPPHKDPVRIAISCGGTLAAASTADGTRQAMRLDARTAGRWTADWRAVTGQAVRASTVASRQHPRVPERCSRRPAAASRRPPSGHGWTSRRRQSDRSFRRSRA